MSKTTTDHKVENNAEIATGNHPATVKPPVQKK